MNTLIAQRQNAVAALAPGDVLAGVIANSEVIFTIAHEVDHALNSYDVAGEQSANNSAIISAAQTGQDVTAAINSYVQDSLDDEASTNIAGWNAVVSAAVAAKSDAQSNI